MNELLLPEDLGEHPMFDDEGRVLLTSLGAAKFLFHLLRCADCRDVALADLGETLDAPQDSGLTRSRP